MLLRNKELKLIPAIIFLKEKNFSKFFQKNYVFLEKKNDWVKVGTWIPENVNYDGIRCLKPTKEQLKLIKLL